MTDAPINSQYAPPVLDALRAAGEPTRLRLLHLLAREELSVMEMVDIIGQSQPRISRHLKLLCEAGLVGRFPEGAFVFYGLRHDSAFYSLVQHLIDHLGGAYDDDVVALTAVCEKRQARALAYFESIAPQWASIRSHHIAESEVEAVILKLAQQAAFSSLVDLGTGSGRMLTLLAPLAVPSEGRDMIIGIDQSQGMLGKARLEVNALGLAHIELRHGDMADTRLKSGCADLVIIHQVLHFLDHPDLALREAARLLTPEGRVIIVDFAPHGLVDMQTLYHHRRLGIDRRELGQWAKEAGLTEVAYQSLKPRHDKGLSVEAYVFKSRH